MKIRPVPFNCLYDLSAALKRLQSESGGNGKSAETTLMAVIMAAGGGDWARAGVDIERQEDGELAIQDREPDPDKPVVR